MSMYDCTVCGEPRCEHVIEEMDTLKAENKKLREALEAIKDKSFRLLNDSEGERSFHETGRARQERRDFLREISIIELDKE